MQTTEGLSWPDTLRWLAEHDGEDIESDYGTTKRMEKATYQKWTPGDAVFTSYIFRLAQRKPRVCHPWGDHSNPAVELIPGMVVLPHDPTDQELIAHGLGEEHLAIRVRALIKYMRVDIDETE